MQLPIFWVKDRIKGFNLRCKDRTWGQAGRFTELVVEAAEPLAQQVHLKEGEKDIRILQHLLQNSLFQVQKYSFKIHHVTKWHFPMILGRL